MEYGNYLGRDEGCFELKRKNGEIEKYPHFSKEIGECILKSGSYVSVDALIDLALWDIDTFIVTKRNRVVAILKNLEDDSHVETRINQYSASLDKEKRDYITKQILKSKITGQNMVLNKYGLKSLDINVNVKSEGYNAKLYFNQIFKLFPEKIRPEKRTGYKAYDGINNVFNFGYYILRCRVHKALLKARLEPYLGFLHSIQHGKPSLVCDFQELYRYLIDDYRVREQQKFDRRRQWNEAIYSEAQETGFSTKYSSFQQWQSRTVRTTAYQRRISNYMWSHPNATLQQARGHAKRKR
jgi:CRISPR-associated endonuclease Cas1